ncbi:hypothetical protein [Candidatus Lokiarchaeum ossiferum]|uniref:hypothetical protein n=1 Tax=Candidatus Lokiarchaeum ossiferum TaxID=2951803 RepID=UPI00352E31C2
MENKKKFGIALSLILIVGFAPIANAETIPGIAISPGDSYVWKVIKTYTGTNGFAENQSYYRLINVTGISTLVETTDVTYNDYVANITAYEGKELWVVKWNETNTDEHLILNNTDPKNNFGGFANLDTADLTIIDDLNETEQLDFLLEFLAASSYDFLIFAFVVALTAAFSTATIKVPSNSSTITSASKNAIEGSLTLGYGLYNEVSTPNVWKNLSIEVDYSISLDDTTKIMTTSSYDMTLTSKQFNETSAAYYTDTSRSVTSEELVYPEEIASSGIMDIVQPLLDKLEDLTGLDGLLAAGIGVGALLLIVIVICAVASKKKK